MADSVSVAGDRFLENGRFLVEVNAYCQDSAKDVQEVHLSPIRFGVRDVSTGNDWDYRVYAPGDMQHMECEITFRAKDVKANSDVKKYFADVKAGKNIRTNWTIKLHNRKGDLCRSWVLNECFPLSLDYGVLSPESQMNMTTLKLSVGYIDFALAMGK